MKSYQGTRTEHGAAVVVNDDGQCRALDPRHDLRDHSPTGFEWGDGGGGPAQLALALAADVLGNDEVAQAVYQRLKFRLIGVLPPEGWILTEDHLRTEIESLRHERRRGR
jgi:hypothetical protein